MSITSSKSQTTRNEIRGVLTSDLGQAVFLDTPGIHRPKRKLGTVTNRKAYTSALDADLIVWVIDQKKGLTNGDKKVYNNIVESGIPIIGVINKVDKTPMEEIAKLLKTLSVEHQCIDYVPVSAKNGTNLDALIKTIFDNLSDGPQFYDEKSNVLVTVKKYVEELVREKYLRFTHEEIPHSILVEAGTGDEYTLSVFNSFVGDLFEEVRNRTLYFDVNIYVERDSQKGIVIGADGDALKWVGTKAREELEDFFDTKIVLKTKVSVKKDWQSNEDLINSYFE